MAAVILPDESVPSAESSENDSSVPSNAYTEDFRSSGTSESLPTRFSKARSLKKKNATRRVLSPAERDLRLLSSKAALSYRQSSFDRLLHESGLVIPYLIIVMLLTYSISVTFLVLEELDPTFTAYGRWVWRFTVLMQILVTTPMWIAMMQWRKFNC